MYSPSVSFSYLCQWSWLKMYVNWFEFESSDRSVLSKDPGPPGDEKNQSLPGKDGVESW